MWGAGFFVECAAQGVPSHHTRGPLQSFFDAPANVDFNQYAPSRCPLGECGGVCGHCVCVADSAGGAVVLAGGGCAESAADCGGCRCVHHAGAVFGEHVGGIFVGCRLADAGCVSVFAVATVVAVGGGADVSVRPGAAKFQYGCSVAPGGRGIAEDGRPGATGKPPAGAG